MHFEFLACFFNKPLYFQLFSSCQLKILKFLLFFYINAVIIHIFFLFTFRFPFWNGFYFIIFDTFKISRISFFYL